MKAALVLPLLVTLGLVGCAADTADRYVVPPLKVEDRIRIGFATVELRDVSLPAYAAADEIAVQDPSGKLTSDASVLWADAPDRAIALELSRNLSQLTRARIAAQPWPFEDLPDARLEVRFETLLAGADGVLRASGQYFLAVAESKPERAGLFELSVPMAPEGGPLAIAQARAQIMLDLSRLLARKALR